MAINNHQINVSLTFSSSYVSIKLSSKILGEIFLIFTKNIIDIDHEANLNQIRVVSILNKISMFKWISFMSK